ncbi:unnamed protein product [Symbiodinium sp. CCMP2592]|nr:unnamed protein product [Symbiodinium sp. CCMP2592]
MAAIIEILPCFLLSSSIRGWPCTPEHGLSRVSALKQLRGAWERFASIGSVFVLMVGKFQVVSNLRDETPLVRCDPAEQWLTLEGGVGGVLVNDTLRVNGDIAPEQNLPYLYLAGGSSGVQVNSSYAENQSATGVARLYLTTQNDTLAGGKGELVALANGGVQLNASDQFISITTSGLANLAVEPNTGGNNDGEVIFGYGFVNLSDRTLKENVRVIPEDELQETFDAVEPQLYLADGLTLKKADVLLFK